VGSAGRKYIKFPLDRNCSAVLGEGGLGRVVLEEGGGFRIGRGGEVERATLTPNGKGKEKEHTPAFVFSFEGT